MKITLTRRLLLSKILGWPQYKCIRGCWCFLRCNFNVSYKLFVGNKSFSTIFFTVMRAPKIWLFNVPRKFAASVNKWWKKLRPNMPDLKVEGLFTNSTGPRCVNTWSTLFSNSNIFQRSTWWTVCLKTSQYSRYKISIFTLKELDWWSFNFQVITNRDTQETLLCIAYVFEVSTSEHGAQHHIYKLVKD